MGYYRQLARVKPAEADIELRDRIQRITLSNRRYGYRRVSAELRRQGFTVNHKKVLRLMRNDNLLAIRKRRYVLTTDSDQQRAAYPNWAKTLQVDGIGQLWQADITYVRRRRSFVYLAVVMDSYSRRVVGWELGPSLEAILALNALRQAIELRRPKPGLLHHSEQGIQYVSRAYVGLLEQCGALISMSRPGNPDDNARLESLYEDAQERGGEPTDVPIEGRSKGFDRGFQRRGLPPTAIAFVAGISTAGGVRGIVAAVRRAQKSEL